ncbi:hypothetical protein GJ496_000885 [Pomphorhynchus laevis]|nr:hypothetical protein GJ496_000885 [Pomphorhynchus laevis]
MFIINAFKPKTRVYELLADNVWSAYMEIFNDKELEHCKIHINEDEINRYVKYQALQLPDISGFRRMRIIMIYPFENYKFYYDHMIYIHHWPLIREYVASNKDTEFLFQLANDFMNITRENKSVTIDNSGFCSNLKFNDKCGEFKNCGEQLFCKNERCKCVDSKAIPVQNGTHCLIRPPTYGNIPSIFKIRHTKGYIFHKKYERKTINDMICNRTCKDRANCPKDMDCKSNRCQYERKSLTNFWTNFIPNKETVKKHVHDDICKIDQDCDFAFVCINETCKCSSTELIPIQNGTKCITNPFSGISISEYVLNESCNEFKECDNNLTCVNNTCQCSHEHYLLERNGTFCAPNIIASIDSNIYFHLGGYFMDSGRIRKKFPLYICKKYCTSNSSCSSDMYCQNNSTCAYTFTPKPMLWSEHISVLANFVAIHGFNESCNELKECDSNLVCINNLCQCNDQSHLPIKNGTICVPHTIATLNDEIYLPVKYSLSDGRIRKVLPNYICKKSCTSNSSCPSDMYCGNTSNCAYSIQPLYQPWINHQSVSVNVVPIHGINESCNAFKECDNNLICIDSVCQCLSSEYIPIQNGTVCLPRPVVSMHNTSKPHIPYGYFIENGHIRKVLPDYICKIRCLTIQDCHFDMFCSENSTCEYSYKPIRFSWKQHVPIQHNIVQIHGLNELCSAVKECDSNFICINKSCQCPSNDYLPVRNGTVCVQRAITNTYTGSFIPNGYSLINAKIRKIFPQYVCDRRCKSNASCPFDMYCHNTANCVYQFSHDNIAWNKHSIIPSNIVRLHVHNESCDAFKECDNNFVCIAGRCQCPSSKLLPVINGTFCTLKPFQQTKMEQNVPNGYLIKDSIISKVFPLYICQRSCLSQDSCPLDMFCDHSFVCSYYVGSNTIDCTNNISCPSGMYCTNKTCQYNHFLSDVSWTGLYSDQNLQHYRFEWCRYRHFWIMLFLTVLTLIVWRMWNYRLIPLYLSNFKYNVELVDESLTYNTYGVFDNSELYSDDDYESLSEGEDSNITRQRQFVDFFDY